MITNQGKQNRTQIYALRDSGGEVRGDYRAFYVPKKSSPPEEKIAKGQRNFISLYIDYTLVQLQVLPAQKLSFFMLQNLDTVADLWLGIGFQPDVTNRRGVLIPALQAFQPETYPQNELWVTGSAVGKAILIYSLD